MRQEVQIDVRFQMEFDVTQSKTDIEKEFDNWMNVSKAQFSNPYGMGLNGYKILDVKEEAEIYQTEATTSDDKPDFEEWLMGLETQTLTDELKEQILEMHKLS